MKWRVSLGAVGTGEETLSLPEALLDDREFSAELNGTTVLARWHQGLAALYIRPVGERLERVYPLRSLSLVEQPEMARVTLVIELAGKTQQQLTATISSGIKLAKRLESGAELAPCVVRSPLTGKVLQLFAVVGHNVQAHETIAIIEAMKMENRICAPRAGIIRSVAVSTNAMVQVGAELAIIQ